MCPLVDTVTEPTSVSQQLHTVTEPTSVSQQLHTVTVPTSVSQQLHTVWRPMMAVDSQKHSNCVLYPLYMCKLLGFSWFQTSAMFWMLFAFLWVIPRLLNFIYRRFGTLCLFHLHRQVGVKNTYLSMKWNRQSVPKRRDIKLMRRGITQKKAYSSWVFVINEKYNTLRLISNIKLVKTDVLSRQRYKTLS